MGLPSALAKTASPRGRSLSQNPNTWANAAGSGTHRSLLPLPITRTDLAVPSTRRPAARSFSSRSRFIQHALRPTPGSFAVPGDGWRIAGPAFAGSPTPVTD